MSTWNALESAEKDLMVLNAILIIMDYYQPFFKLQCFNDCNPF